MMLHKIIKRECIRNALVNDHTIECSQCKRHIGFVYAGKVYLLNGFKKYEEEFRNSRSFKEYTEQRNKMDETDNAEWRSFLRDLKFDEDEILPLETTDEWLPENSEWGNTVGC